MPTIATYTGELVDLAAPSLETIDAEDLAVQLSRTYRFNGATRWPYTVAQHLVLSSRWRRVKPDLGKEPIPRFVALVALLHDAHEIYVGDVVRPVKDLLGGVLELEKQLSGAVLRRFGISLPLERAVIEEVRAIDNAILRVEASHLSVPGIAAPDEVDLAGCPMRRIVPWHPEAARDLFSERLSELLTETRP